MEARASTSRGSYVLRSISIWDKEKEEDVLIWESQPCDLNGDDPEDEIVQGTQSCDPNEEESGDSDGDEDVEGEVPPHLVYFPAGEVITSEGVTNSSGVLLPCGHVFVFDPMEDAYLSEILLCQVPILKIYPCGNEILLKCCELSAYSEQLAKCRLPCHTATNCGHPCPSPGECHFVQDPSHTSPEYQCPMPCERSFCSRDLHVNCAGSHECGRGACPPCQVEIKYELECGHSMTRLCSEPSPQESGYTCQENCRRKLPNCDHECDKLCGEDCGKCTMTVAKRYPNCPYRHVTLVPCWQPLPMDLRCEIRILLRNKQTCGHKEVKVPCCESDKYSTSQVNAMCRVHCFDWLEDTCGHGCTGSCGECFRFMIHKRCEQKCEKIMICNHQCASPCGAGCPPCKLPCIRKCEHKKCEKLCGMVCHWECKEECSYRCAHGRCTRSCDEVCDKEPCNEPCPKILACGHSCVGFCGEPCPPYCFYCDHATLSAGAIISCGEVDELDRFIFLEECGHAVESCAMDHWMEQESGDGEILPFRCPVCRTRMAWMHRYSRLMEENWKNVESVKATIFGDEDDIQLTIQYAIDTMKTIETRIERDPEAGTFCPEILAKVKSSLEDEEGRSRMTQSEIDSLWWVLIQWKDAQPSVKKFENCLLVQKMATMEDRWTELFEHLWKRDWPLQKAEADAFMLEKRRLADYTLLYSAIKDCFQTNEDAFARLFYGELGEKLFKEAEEPIKARREYDFEARELFRKRIKKFAGHMKVTVAVSREEIEQIVGAVNKTLRTPATGHWFKCRNGHIYVVTECGGAMTRAVCIECHETIGGSRHVFDEGNFLAPEMDGAEEGRYDALVTAWNRRAEEERERERQAQQ